MKPSLNWHDYFTYDAVTGDLIWRKRPIEHFRGLNPYAVWNSKFAETKAGSKAYAHKTQRPLSVVVTIHGEIYRAHRIIWEMHHGPIPQGMFIDHKDCNPFNNKLENIRLATTSQNNYNCSVKPSKSGLRGAYLDKHGRYKSFIRMNGKQIYLGKFDTAEDANAAYESAAANYHKSFKRYDQ